MTTTSGFFPKPTPASPRSANWVANSRNKILRNSNAHGHRFRRLARRQGEQGLSLLSLGRFVRPYELFERCAFVLAEFDRHGLASLFDFNGGKAPTECFKAV